MTIYFTSDTHFGHRKILEYSEDTRAPSIANSNSKSIETHDDYLIFKWNSVVRTVDTIYHLGDFSLTTWERTKYVLSQLNGTKFLIRGNHDKGIDLFKSYFVWIRDYHRLKVTDPATGDRQDIILSHFPFEIWDKSHHGSWHLHGHCHGSFPSGSGYRRLDVGVDVHNLTPISLDQVREIMSKKVFVPVDRHGAD